MSVLTLILAGGAAAGMTVLTRERPKSMLPFGGSFRLIDLALSNTANSGFHPVGLLAQFLPQSLIEHVGAGDPWGFDLHQNGLQVWLPSLERTGQPHYTGTADAVYQNRRAILEAGCETTVIVSGVHVCLLDYRPLVAAHRQSGAEVTVLTYPLPEQGAARYGQLMVDEHQRITHFVEKPAQPAGTHISLAIYAFDTPALLRRLERDALDPYSRHDFGENILPAIVADGGAYAYPLDGFWSYIGTLTDYWKSSMALLADPAPLDLNDLNWPVRSRIKENGLAHVAHNGRVNDCLLTYREKIAGEVSHSILGPGVQVATGAVVRNAVLMGGVTIGAGAVVEDCVLDESVEVGAGAVICAGQENHPNPSGPDFLSDGLSVIGARARIPAGAVIGRNCRVDIGVGPEDFTSLHVASGTTVEKSH